jgi:hypothetical protein
MGTFVDISDDEYLRGNDMPDLMALCSQQVSDDEGTQLRFVVLIRVAR